jgi:hypothetical protein
MQAFYDAMSRRAVRIQLSVILKGKGRGEKKKREEREKGSPAQSSWRAQ